MSTSLAIKFDVSNVLLLRPSSGYLGGLSIEMLLSLNLIASAVDSVRESFAWFCQPLVFSYAPVDLEVCKSCTLRILNLEIPVLDATLSDGDGRLPFLLIWRHKKNVGIVGSSLSIVLLEPRFCSQQVKKCIEVHLALVLIFRFDICFLPEDTTHCTSIPKVPFTSTHRSDTVRALLLFNELFFHPSDLHKHLFGQKGFWADDEELSINKGSRKWALI